MSTAAIYARISQDTEGTEVGVDNQIATCRALAEQHGLEVVQVFTDNDRGASSLSKKSRPAYSALTQAAQRGEFGTVIAYSMSRLTRRPSEWEDLITLAQSRGVAFVYKVSPAYDLNTADGRATARTVAAWDAAEAERTGERVKHAMTAKLARGEDIGGPRPFGWESDRKRHRQVEADMIRAGADAILTGSTVYRVALAWTESGVLPPRAGRGSRSGEASAKWRPQTVRSILSNPRQAGRLVVKGVDYGQVAEPILTDDQHQALVAIFDDPNRKPKRGPIPRSSVGLGWIKCGVCGRALATQVNRGVAGLRCADAPYEKGKHPQISAAVLDRMVRDRTLGRLLTQVAEGGAPEESATPVAVTTARLAVTELERQRAAWQGQATWAGADVALIQRNVEELSAEIAEKQAGLDSMLTSGTTSRAVMLAREFVHGLGDESEGGYVVYGRAAAKLWAVYWDRLEVPDRRDLARGVLGDDVRLALYVCGQLHRLTIDGVEPPLKGDPEPLGEEW